MTVKTLKEIDNFDDFYEEATANYTNKYIMNYLDSLKADASETTIQKFMNLLNRAFPEESTPTWAEVTEFLEVSLEVFQFGTTKV